MALGPLNQIHLSVTDLDRSVTFYREVLGLDFQFRVPGQPMAFFTSGEVRLYLGVPESEQYRTRSLLYFTVEDIEAEYRRLVAAGVAMESEPHLVHRDGAGELWMAFFADPDQHQLAITQLRPA